MKRVWLCAENEVNRSVAKCACTLFHFLPATNGKYFFEPSVEQIQ